MSKEYRNTICPRCKKGKMRYYHGWLGYESFQCDKCHYDVNETPAETKVIVDNTIKLNIIILFIF